MGHQSFFETEKSPQTRMNTKKNVPDSKIRHIIWWGKVDSDHRSRRQQIYSLPPLAARDFPQILITAQRTANIKRIHMQSALSEKRLELVKGFEPPTC